MTNDLTWTKQDQRAVDSARVIAMDAVENAGSGHPGTAISMAPVAYLLYQKVMNLDFEDDKWIGRDRFVLSAGHASILQYAQLYLAGLGLELDDLKSLRRFGSLTPGHPEYGHTKFIECTTGPLGSGISMAVGMAMATRREHGLYDPETPAGESVFDHYVYCLAGDGCMQEGVSSEASSLAGTQRLGNLILFYDNNQITIEGSTQIAFNEDVCARYAAYGWHTLSVDWTEGEDIQALYSAIEEAKQVTDQPSLIQIKSIIGYPLPTKKGTSGIHGAKIGGEEISAVKKLLGFEDEPFALDFDAVQAARDNVVARSKAAREAWDAKFDIWQQANPDKAALLTRVQAGELPADIQFPTFEPGSMATRAASGKVLAAIGKQLPELWGGSADLAGSNNTTIAGEQSFLPEDRVPAGQDGGPYGRVLHFGIREHGMGGALNGINLSGLTRAYGGTFLVFSDYMRPAVRLAALMNLPTIFVWTHDSIGVGEDGPTHQPVEHLAALRAMPNLAVARPMDANETSVCWRKALESKTRPTGLVLSRQNLETVERSDNGCASAAGAAKGAYVLKDASAAPKVILISSGSEVTIALQAQTKLEADGIPTRVVSMPCWEWFEDQDDSYKASVLPGSCLTRVAVEAGSSFGWERYLAHGKKVTLDHYGASGAAGTLFEEFGFTPDHVVDAAKQVVRGMF